MTISICVKANDGLVLASDSASSMVTTNNEVVNTYDNANKIFNLRKGLPIGAATYGQGNIGPASISTLAKDFRVEITNGPSPLAPTTYTMNEVVDRMAVFFGGHYDATFSDIPEENRPLLAFIVAGYSAGAPLSEQWLLQFPGPLRMMQHGQTQCGIAFGGVTAPIQRLIGGFSPELSIVLQRAGLDDATRARVLSDCQSLAKPLISDAMPIQDAADLAEYLVNLTASFVRFDAGPPTVGGPIELAAITKHEGFKWIKRKHFFTAALNP